MTSLLSKIRSRIKHKVLAFTARKPIHLLHIGKTGGTAIQHALRPHAQTGHRDIRFHKHAAKLRDIPPGEKVIFFLRDPISRYISGFNSRHRKGQPRYFVRWAQGEHDAFTVFLTPNDLAVAMTSQDVGLREKAVKAMNEIQHVRDVYWSWFHDESYFRSRLDDVFFIGFQETLSADFELLKRKLGLPDHVELPSDDVNAHRSPESSGSRLEDRAVENLKSWYAKDYAFLEMCKELAPQINARALS